MGYFYLQEHLGLFESIFSHRRSSSKQSLMVLCLIIFVHLLVIMYVFNEKLRQRELTAEKTLRMISLLPEPVKSIEHLDEPDISKPHLLQLATPVIQFSESIASDLDAINNLPYDPSADASGQYANVFDPKFRKKLLESQHYNIPRKIEKSSSWTDSDGRVFVDMGNGQCLVSMQKMDSRERGTNWGATRCGKTNSEKMMDRVNADIEARKHPLNKKGQQ